MSSSEAKPGGKTGPLLSLVANTLTPLGDAVSDVINSSKPDFRRTDVCVLPFSSRSLRSYCWKLKLRFDTFKRMIFKFVTKAEDSVFLLFVVSASFY